MTRAVSCSPIEMLVQSGKYSEALSAYQQLESPMPNEDRLAGRAYWGMGDFLKAELYLTRAMRRDDHGAAVDLIQLSVLSHNFDGIENRINSINLKNIQLKEQLQLKYLKGEILFRKNRLSHAEKELKSVWIEACSSDGIGSLVQSIGQSLASVLHLKGSDREAIRVIDISLKNAPAIWQMYLNSVKAQILAFIGDYESSSLLLKDIENSSFKNPQINFFAKITQSTVNFLNGDTESSIFILENELEVYVGHADYKPIICRAYYYLIGMLIFTGRLQKARVCLIKFEMFLQNECDRALLNHRLGQYHLALNNFQAAFECLEKARDVFFHLEWRRELSWTLLQIAQTYLHLNKPEKATEVLDSLADLIHVVGNSKFLELEKKFIADLEPLSKVASEYGHQAVFAPSTSSHVIETRPIPRSITLNCFGIPSILLNHQPISCKLYRGLSVLAYLLIHPHSSLEQILTDVFDDSKSVESARSYFHTSRYELTQVLPFVRIAYNRITKTYDVETSNIPIEFDYHIAIRLLHAPTENEFYQALDLCRGAFLHGFEGAWIEEVRANMEWLLVRSGLKLVQEMYESGDFQACRRLTERLLKVEPFDESLNELLVRATREVEGALASRKAMSKVESQFLQEVGELPPTLAQLKSEMKFRVN